MTTTTTLTTTPDHWVEKFIDLKGVRMRYHRTGGNKPAMLLLHGFSDNGLCWTHIAKSLEDTYDIVMIDARAHGQSVPKNDTFSIEALADDAAELIQALQLNKPVVMGHSMGGQTASMLAANYPNLISRIILSDPAYRLKTKGGKLGLQIMGLVFAAMIKRNQKKTEVQIQKFCRKFNPKWHEDEVVPWANASAEFAKKESVGILKKMGSPIDWHQIFPKIAAPTLLLIPDRGMLKLIDAEKILPEFPAKNARIVFVEKSGHNVRRDNYPAFMEAIQQFLAE